MEENKNYDMVGETELTVTIKLGEYRELVAKAYNLDLMKKYNDAEERYYQKLVENSSLQKRINELETGLPFSDVPNPTKEGK